MAVRDPYKVLGVARDASQDEIQRAYRKLARAFHPDINKGPEAEEKFKDVAEAYAILSDPEQRRRYDTFGADFRQVPPDVDPAMWARTRRGAGAGATSWAGAGRGPGGGFETRFGEDIDLDALFGGGFFGRRGPGGWGPVPGADQEAELEVSVEEAYHGGRRSITFDGGRTIQVTLPPGVTEGQRIRVAGQGGRGVGGPPGDLYLVVRIAPHPRFRVRGRDLHVDLRLTPWEAALGTSVPVRTPGGEAQVRVPPGSSSGRRLRLRGRGLPNPRGSPGDLYAEVRIMIPATLTDQERRLYEQLAATSSFDPRKA
ncbi:J domain-containing protein [Nonomuraea africana]|uniref:Curved DNA-binding protein n=1 Tax=Nonomuraea africana TaxID=46171 RepID=A0ABR9KB04_9ACTN|nr:DnaJ C-terminal domain-containing protein [Nonomuraea africana]MBE1559192.1 curved DNA-binding protein [Nonomuraea africana]